MKWIQHVCQQKLVNDFIMILLCFQHFQFYLLGPPQLIMPKCTEPYYTAEAFPH